MKTGKAGIELIKKYEGCELKAYLCPAKVWTIGYGSTGPHVKPGMKITLAEAEALLKQDLVRFEKGVLAAVAPATPNQNEFDAMVSLAFNIGIAAFTKSTVAKRFKASKKVEAANAFGMWVKAGGKTLAGLVKRRASEKALFLTALAVPSLGIAAIVETPVEEDETKVRPETATVPQSIEKPLVLSKEVGTGVALAGGGMFQFLDVSIDDLAAIKNGVTEFKAEVEQNPKVAYSEHMVQGTSAALVLLGAFIMYKRIKARLSGHR